jgi:hypothetical protein
MSMLNSLLNSALVGSVQKGTGVAPTGPVTTALITTGASLLLTRGRRPVGLALLVVGGLLLWREVEKEHEEARSGGDV